MEPETVLYFAYGSNCDPDRFRARVGEWRSRRRGRLAGYRLRFADSVRSEGGGGAVVDPDPDGAVDGVLFEITSEQLAAMDREEFARERDRQGAGLRMQVTVQDERGEDVRAELYTVQDDGGRCAPSEAYLGHIQRGLEAAGHDAAALERVRRAPLCGVGAPPG